MLGLGKWQIEDSAPLLATADNEKLRWQDPATPLRISQVDTPGLQVFRLRISADFAVDVLPDSRIVIRRNAPIPQESIEHFLADQVIPRVLAHQGSFVFHAGAVGIGGNALVFTGPSGRGKSTLTASYSQHGHTLLGDDAMVLSWLDAGPQVTSVYPSLRLFPDSLKALMPSVATAGRVSHYSAKQRIDVKVAAGNPVPLPIQALLAIANPSSSGEIAIRRLSASEACLTLVEGSFSLDPTDLDRAHQRLEEASRLANAVPAFELSYPHDYTRLPEVHAAVASALGIPL